MGSHSMPCVPKRLRRLLDDDLTATERAEVLEHLDACATCRGTLESLAAGSRWWDDLRRLARPDRPPDPSAPTVTMGEPRRGRSEEETEAGHPADDEPPLDFLGPPGTPGHLGRFGPYEVHELIGRGGMGVVLKAFDPALHRLVAIKVLAPQLATTATARRRFTREARAAASVVHDHVVTIHAVDEAAGFPYLVMQYVRGLSLQERIDRTGPLELKEIVRIGMQAAQGLAAAHAQGLVHRDVKPSNILLENGVERVKLTDFGLARAADDASLTQSGVVTGTPQYMAPEQARGEVLDHRADLFSLGSVLYAMGTGRSPFRAESTVAVLRRVCEDTPRPIREVNPEVPDWLAAIVERLHAKDPADRFQTAAEVAELLARHLARLQQPSLPPVDSIPAEETPLAVEATAAPASRRRRVAAAAVLLLLLPLGGLGLAEATGVSAFLATVLRIPTRDGVLVVEVDDPEVRVDVDGDAIAIRGAGVREIRLRPGPHRVRATKGGEPVLTELVTLSRGGRQVVKVHLEPGHRTPVAGGGPRLAAGPPEAGVAREIGRLVGHTGPVYSVVFLPDGRRALSGSGFPQGDKTMRLWDVDTGRELRQFQGNTGDVMCVAISPDGRRALSGTTGETMHLWDVETGQEQRRLVGHVGPLNAVAFLPDSRRALSGGNDKTIRLFDLASEDELRVLHGHADRVTSVAVSPDGRRALSGGRDKTVRVWDLEDGRELHILRGHEHWVLCVAVSPDGRRALSGGLDGALRLWDVEQGREVRTIRSSHGGVQGVAFTPDGRSALAGYQDRVARLWDLETGRELRRFRGHRDFINSVAVSPDGRRALSASGGFYDLQEKRHMPGSDWSIRLWELPEPATSPVLETVGEIRRFEGHEGAVKSVALTPDGRLAVSGSGYPYGDKTMRLWDVATGREIRRFRGHTDQVMSVTFTPDGRRALSGGADRTMRLWDVATGEELRRFKGHTNGVESVAVSRDGRRALSGGADRTVRLWDLETGEELRRLEGHTKGILGVAFAPDGRRVLSGSFDATVRLWDADTGREVRSFLGHESAVEEVAVSPDGRRVVSAGQDGTIRLWDLEGGEELRRFLGHAGTVSSVALSPDGRHVFSTGRDSTVRQWDSGDGREVRRFEGHQDMAWSLSLSADGSRLLTGSGGALRSHWERGRDWTLRLWDIPGADAAARPTPPR